MAKAGLSKYKKKKKKDFWKIVQQSDLESRKSETQTPSPSLYTIGSASLLEGKGPESYKQKARSASTTPECSGSTYKAVNKGNQSSCKAWIGESQGFSLQIVWKRLQ